MLPGPSGCTAGPFAPPCLIRHSGRLTRVERLPIAEVVALAQQAEGWRASIEQARNQGRDLPAAEALAGQAIPRPMAEAVVADVVERVRRSPRVRPYLASIERLEAKLRAAKQAVDALPKDSTAEARARARAEAEADLIMAFEAGFLAELDKLKNPAEYARNFLEGEIKAKYFDRPYTVGEVQFKLVNGEFTRSLFAEDADIGIVISYAGGIELKAHGLSFKYKAGGLPEPRFDRVKVEPTDLSALSNLSLKGLGDAIPTLGNDRMAIKIVKPEFLGFAGDAGGGLKFGIEIGGFLDFADLKLSADDIRVYPDGKRVDVKDLGCTVPTIVPVGNTGLIFDGYGMTYRPKGPAKEQVSLKTFLAPASGGKQALSLDITITFGFPINEVKFEGALVLGRTEALGRVEGLISATGQEVSGKLIIPDPRGGALPIGEAMKADFKFKLDREGFTADGLVSLFQAAQWSMDLALKFDGNGSISAREQLKLCGVDVGATLAARFTPGFRTIELKALLSVNVDLKLFRADASVQVEAKSPGSPAVSVVARAMGAEAAFELSSLNDLTPARVTGELAKQLGNMLQNLAAAASQWEKDKKILLANWDKHWKEEISNQAKRLGLDHWDTGNPEVNRLLGQVSQDGKALGGWLSDTGKGGGKEVSEFIKNPAAKAGELPGNISRELGNVAESAGDFISGGFGFGGNKQEKHDDGPSPAEIKAKEWADKFNARLGEMVMALNDPGFRIDVVPDAASRKAAGNEKLLTRRELHVSFGDAVSASAGDGNGSAGFTVRGSGFLSAVNTRSPGQSRRESGSSVVACSVDIAGLISDEARTPKARIALAELLLPRDLDATNRARDKVQELVERLLPEVELEGIRKLTEKRIVVENLDDEPVTVWYHARRRAVADRQARQEWQPGLADEPARVVIPAKSRQYLFKGEGRATSDIVQGSALQIWAESESGGRWEDHRRSALLVVDRNPAMDGERAYRAAEPAPYWYTLKPKAERRTFSERMLVLRNDTPEPITVSLRYRTTELGQARWKALDRIELPPGQSLRPRGDDGFAVRASRIAFTADAPSRRYRAHEHDPLWLVDQVDGLRQYRSEKIGSYTQIFDSNHRDSVAGR